MRIRQAIVRWAIAGCVLCPAMACATDLPGVLPLAIDQPHIYAGVSLAPNGPPQLHTVLSIDWDTFEIIEIQTPAIEAYFDTGASGVLFGASLSEELGAVASTYNNQPVNYRDYGVGGYEDFGVSQPLYISLAPYNSSVDVDNVSTYSTVFNQTFSSVRVQISHAAPDPLTGDELNIIGIPLMQGRVIVFDPKPANPSMGDNLDSMRSYVYNPGTPYHAASVDSDPGIPNTSRHVKLSYGDLSAFTEVTPTGADGPTLAGNPFIGASPIRALGSPADNTPGITVTYNGAAATGSWLLDTGGQVSMISSAQALKLGVSYDPATVDTDNPVLRGVPTAEQFVIPIGGVGSEVVYAAGFYLDSLLLTTEEGSVSNPNHDNNIRFLGAPVLVHDISAQDPITGKILTLDGTLGMNYLVSSWSLDPITIFGDLQDSYMDWFVFDQPNGTLGLQLTGSTERSIAWTGDAGAAGAWDLGTAQTWYDGVGAGGYANGDHVRFTDSAANGGAVSNALVTIAQAVAPGSVVFDNSQLNYTIAGQAITGATGVTKYGTGVATFQNSNTYTGATEILQGSMVFAASQNIGPVHVYGGTSLNMQASQKFEALSIVDGVATLEADGHRMLVLNGLSITGEGKLDLADNAAVIHATAGTRQVTIDQIGAYIASGCGIDRSWSGSGLTSSAAAANPNMGLAAIVNEKLDAIGNASPMVSDFGGETVDINSILVKYTLNGDSNLDGQINFEDLSQLNRGFLSQGTAHPLTGYRWGDFNYDGKIDFADYILINSAYLYQNPGGAPLALSGEMMTLSEATVPEPPAAVVLLALGGLLLARRAGKRSQC